jgi:endonuclease/exonuclease/phosphatase family metal-dependent hydrolase
MVIPTSPTHSPRPAVPAAVTEIEGGEMKTAARRKSQACKTIQRQAKRSLCAGAAALAALVWILLAPLASPASQAGGHKLVKVMTYNVDEGTDYIELLGATSFTDFLAAVQLTWNNVQATDPAVRAVAIAQQISSAEPDFVALQEATLWRTGSGPFPTDVAYDFIELIRTELARQGHPYNLVVSEDEFDLQAPSPTGMWIRATNRDAILARADLEPDTFTIRDTQKGHYSVNLQLNTPLGLIEIPRGWAYVDASVRGTNFRLITTHLEDGEANAFFVPIQIAQSQELLAGPGSTTQPVILLGDFNATADNPANPSFAAYSVFTGAGCKDAWSEINPALPGLTCCQTPGDMDPISRLDRRIDLVFTRGPIQIDTAKRYGADPDQDLLEGLWPSDHAAVAVKVDFAGR